MVANAPEITVAIATTEAPAKLNLTLEVLGRRPDGFHDIRSVVIGVGLTDRVTARARLDDHLALCCLEASLENEDNLAFRAARLLQRLSATSKGLAIELVKTIPVGGGLGGGSSDAAAALRVCNDLWSLGRSDEELAALGAQLGSDVPLFFGLPSALMAGRGEDVTRVALRWSGWALLVFVPESVSTAAAYQAWSTGTRPADARRHHESVISATTAGDVMAAAFNDLEPAVLAIAPRVAQAYRSLLDLKLSDFRISGAGSTFYQLHDDKEAACRTARTITDADIGVKTAVVAAPAGTSPIRRREE
jgi:4-diphosphocytidyl-2-C-methyl-D-erythritol kinase